MDLINMEQKNYKRQYRELSQETKDKISQSMRGRAKSYMHRQHLSTALTNYWEGVPSKNNDANTNLTNETL